MQLCPLSRLQPITTLSSQSVAGLHQPQQSNSLMTWELEKLTITIYKPIIKMQLI